MRKVDLRVEFLKLFVVFFVLFVILVAGDEFTRTRSPLSTLVPSPSAFRDHPLAWRCTIVLAASLVGAVIATALAWFSRSDWKEVLESEAPVEPSRAGFHYGVMKITIGAVLAIIGLIARNPVIVIGATLIFIPWGMWWIRKYQRDRQEYEADIAQWNRVHASDRDVSEMPP
jgi:hypothetical protein